MFRIVTSFNDDVLEVDAAELLDLERQGLVVEHLDAPADGSPLKLESSPAISKGDGSQ